MKVTFEERPSIRPRGRGQGNGRCEVGGATQEDREHFAAEYRAFLSPPPPEAPAEVAPIPPPPPEVPLEALEELQLDELP